LLYTGDAFLVHPWGLELYRQGNPEPTHVDFNLFSRREWYHRFIEYSMRFSYHQDAHAMGSHLMHSQRAARAYSTSCRSGRVLSAAKPANAHKPDRCDS